MNNYRVIIDFVGDDLEACRKAAERVADRIVAELNENGKNMDEDNFAYQNTRTSYPLVISNVEEPYISAQFEEELNPNKDEKDN